MVYLALFHSGTDLAENACLFWSLETFHGKTEENLKSTKGSCLSVCTEEITLLITQQKYDWHHQLQIACICQSDKLELW